MSYTATTTLILGPSYTGKGSDGDSSFAYSVVSRDGVTEQIAQTSAGLTERPAGSGSYNLQFEVESAWGLVDVRFFLNNVETGEIKWTFNCADLVSSAAILAAVEAGGTGAGDVTVDHNYGSTDALRVLRDGVPIDNAIIRAYVAADYAAGSIDPRPATTTTGSDGRWIAPLMLDADDYRINVYDPAAKTTSTFYLTVT